MTAQLQKELIEQADKESDSLALANYEQLKAHFMNDINDKLSAHLMEQANKGLENLQQLSNAELQYLGQVPVQILQNLNSAQSQRAPMTLQNLQREPQLSGQSFYLINLNNLVL